MTSHPVDLSTCADEPIHIPGAIQAHGWLLATDENGIVTYVSANVGPLLGRDAASLLGRPIHEVHPLGDQHALRQLAERKDVSRVLLGGRELIVLVHALADQLIIELESPDEMGPTDEYVSLLRLLHQPRDVAETLQLVSDKVRALTGFDRVMVYRFLPDHCGEIIAESRHEDIEPFLHRRYPAGDIPAQARRLYTVNLMRQITDVDAPPVQLLSNVPNQRPLDLSRAELRSVSPIHIEYLKNMGVRASFSISVIMGGRLWGLIGCHHRRPAHVRHTRRALVGLLAQHIAGVVDAEQRRESAEALALTSATVRRVLGRAMHDHDLLDSLDATADDLMPLVDATGLVVSLDKRVATAGVVPERESVRALLAILARGDGEAVIQTQRSSEAFDGLELGADAAGVLAVCFNRPARGWLVWLRPEVAKTIVWGGDPTQKMGGGPNGDRLTPRGSFSKYFETVRGQSEPWSSVDQQNADTLRRGLTDIALGQAAEAAKVREVALATLGHDLRNPLGAITMASEVLRADGGGTGSSAMADRIARSSTRMRRLIDNIMELALIQSGRELHVNRETVDVPALVGNVADETRIALAANIVVTPCTPFCAAVDGPRLEQVLANLLSNARHHGDREAPITVDVVLLDDHFELRVHNHGPPIPDAAKKTLFDAFVGSGSRSSRGLGLGLHIVSQIATAHGGSVDVTDAVEGGVRFVVGIPLVSIPAPTT